MMAGYLRRAKMGIDDPDAVFKVVINDEEQYSIWPAERSLPLGWRAAGVEATKNECLAFIETAWTDMRPLSVRTQLGDA
jgi:MbtH protein